MLSDALSFFSTRAEKVNNVDKLDKNDLIRLYIENENTIDADNYLSAIIVKYWHLISYYYRKNSNFEDETYLAWIIEGIMKGLNVRSWTDTSKYISKDEEGPRKVLDRCINTVILNHYYLEDMDKRKVNHLTWHLGGHNDGLIDFLNEEEFADSFIYEYEEISTCEDIVQNYINKGDMVSAVVVDTICFQDSVKKDKINLRNVCDNLINLDDNYKKYFKKKYMKVNNDLLNTTIIFFKDMDSRKRYRCIKAVLNNFKNNKKMMELLCS